MSAFTLLAIAMTLIAMAIVALPLLRAGHGRAAEGAKSNVDLLREQAAELDADLARGLLSPAQHGQAHEELQRRVLEEAGPARAQPRPRTRAAGAAIAAASLAIPVLAAVIYLHVGAPQLASRAIQTQGAGGELTRAEVEDFAAQMSARVKANPGDAEAWLLLARSHAFMEQPQEAMTAYRQAIAAAPRTAAPLVELAELLYQNDRGDVHGEARELIARALAIEPRDARALALAGRLALDAGDFAAAIQHWETLRAMIPKESSTYAAIEAGIAEARAHAGMPAAPDAAPAAVSASVTGTVTLKEGMAEKVAPGDTLFVFARAMEGPRMPLAVLRRPASELPLAFTLDDSMAMAPGMSLSSAGEFTVVARISRSGNVAPQSGDLEGSGGPVRPGATGIRIEIDRVVP
ncbi:MAG: c-type cytochrome biogenesis protein CcmI [Gammaproteobacteria bacterium]|nr:c-type cytochrome biogenesis protein CcmI [Gammaproteobacteria bacterium]